MMSCKAAPESLTTTTTTTTTLTCATTMSLDSSILSLFSLSLAISSCNISRACTCTKRYTFIQREASAACTRSSRTTSSLVNASRSFLRVRLGGGQPDELVCGLHACLKCFVSFSRGRNVACGDGSIACITRHVKGRARHTSNVTHHTSHVKRHASHVTRHTSRTTRHTSHVTHHTSHVTRHTSHVTHPPPPTCVGG